MTTLILGAAGMLGQALLAEGSRRGEPQRGLDQTELDITDRKALLAAIEDMCPVRIINCAALTAVDECERRRDEAMAVNAIAVGSLAEAAEAVGAALIQLSTDFVFDGRRDEPYSESASTGPLSVYGESKLRGEEAALEYERGLVVRTSWLFGPGGTNFVTMVADLLREGRTPLRIVGDQVGCPTYAPFLARALWELCGLRTSGILHYRNRDPISWHGFAEEIVSLLGRTDEVVAISSDELARPAPRPAYSALDVTKVESLLGRQVESWREGLVEYLNTIRDEGLQ